MVRLQYQLQVRDLEAEDVSGVLKDAPNMWHLVKSVPYSIPLIETIYEKCEQVKILSLKRNATVGLW